MSVIGYISTKYGVRSVVDTQKNVDSYLSLYSSIDGFFLDEMSSRAVDLPHYANISSYIRRIGRLEGDDRVHVSFHSMYCIPQEVVAFYR